jgi:hypothetical protein
MVPSCTFFLFLRIARVRSSGQWAALAALIFLGSSGFRDCKNDNNDTPMMSQHGADTGPGVVEGVGGLITDACGRPITGAFIRPRGLDEPSPAIPEIAIVSDSQGRYRWRLVPGKYEISVSAEGYRDITKQITIKRGQQVILNFTLEPVP